MRTGPSIKRHQSKQDYCTPDDFMRAVIERFGSIDFDLAATKENTKAKRFYDLERNSLKQDWRKLKGTLWLNPPFNDIAPWARKCAQSVTQHNCILLLTPASVGSNWFHEYVINKANVLALNPRLSFDSRNAYPKDLILSVFIEVPDQGFKVWKWKQTSQA